MSESSAPNSILLRPPSFSPSASPNPSTQKTMATEPALPQGHGDGDSIVDRDVCLACAVPFSRVPTVGAEVYYFPDGHAEQHLLAPLPASHRFPCTCTVTDVSLGAEDRTDEVFVKISLRPGPAAASRPEPGPGSSNSPRQGLSYFVNELLHRDKTPVPAECSASHAPARSTSSPSST